MYKEYEVQNKNDTGAMTRKEVLMCYKFDERGERSVLGEFFLVGEGDKQKFGQLR